MRKLLVLFSITILLFSCNEGNKDAATKDNANMSEQMDAQFTTTQVSLGDLVPSDQVCMVNNDYMGRDQIEVNVDGKTYYGCCKMCEERLPVDETVRVAVDPISKNQVDKADAIIAVTGGKGEVSYFENEANYEKYVETVLN